MAQVQPQQAATEKEQRDGIPAPRERLLGQKKGISWMASTILLTNLSLAVLIVWAWIEFGSISSALAFLRGHRLIPDSYTRTIGTVDSSSDQVATFELTNHAKRPITILGARSSCSCVVADDKLPIRFLYKEKRLLTIKIHTAATDGGFFERIILYTDYPEQREVILVLSGRVNQHVP